MMAFVGNERDVVDREMRDSRDFPRGKEKEVLGFFSRDDRATWDTPKIISECVFIYEGVFDKNVHELLR